jgi:hypothetical protein
MTNSLSSLATEIYRSHTAAVDAKLASLLSTGVSKERIRLEQHPGPKIIVCVDEVPVAAFCIDLIGAAPL